MSCVCPIALHQDCTEIDNSPHEGHSSRSKATLTAWKVHTAPRIVSLFPREGVCHGASGGGRTGLRPEESDLKFC
jgi:hypothetical protein